MRADYRAVDARAVTRLRRIPLTAAAVAVYALAYAGFLLLTDSSAGVHLWIDDLGYVALIAAAVGLAFRASRHPHVDPGARRAWRCIGAALACWATGCLIWFWLALRGLDPFPSVGDLACLMFYPLMLVGILRLQTARGSRRGRLTFALDTVIVVAGAWMALWYLLIGPALQAPDSDAVAGLLSAAYPAGDLVLALAVVTALRRAPAPPARRVLRLLGAGLAVQLAADLVLSYTAMTGSYATGGWADALWAGGTAFVALAAIAQTSPRSEGAGWTPGAARRAHGAVLPVAAVAVGVVVLWAAVGELPFFPFGGLMVGATALIAAVVTRQVLALREALHAHEHVADRERGLEQLIAVRTAELSATEAHFRALIQNSSDVTTFVDRDLIIRWQSESVRRVLGWDPKALIGMGVLEVLEGAHRHPVCGAMRRASAERGTPVIVEVDVPASGGKTRRTETAVTRLPADAPRQGWILNSRDITPQHELKAELSHQAFHDPLTGLANRSLLGDRLDHAIARAGRTAQPLAILAIDLDDFKAVNDSLGHATGDGLLREVARRLGASVRQGDTVARLGGDEFAVLLDPADEAHSIEVAARILEALREPCRVGTAELAVDASIGISGTEHEPATAVELLRNADLALYQAKARGKHTWACYQADLHEAASRRLDLHSGLRQAIERDELAVAYQPIFDLTSGRLLSAEALLRWNHGRLGAISPSEFIPIAEETGLILSLGAWVLERACTDAAAWEPPDPGRPAAGVSVNISGRQLAAPGIVDQVRRALESTGLPPERLMLEFTETVLVDDVEGTAARLSALKALGVRIAIDDFGTGYSSLAALSRFPADILKIDRSFVGDMCSSARHHDLADTVVRLGRALGMTTVAEGIETEAQQAALKSLGCQVGQGFLLGRPVAEPALRELLAGAAAASG